MDDEVHSLVTSSGPYPLGVGWISTLMELRQDVTLILAPSDGRAFLVSHRPNCATSRIVILAGYNRSAGEETGDECNNTRH